jgi:hypothetical protein
VGGVPIRVPPLALRSFWLAQEFLGVKIKAELHARNQISIPIAAVRGEFVVVGMPKLWDMPKGARIVLLM